MAKAKQMLIVLILGILVFVSVPSWAAFVYDTEWNPPDVQVTASHPYYFPLVLPAWDFDKGDYTAATFDLTYSDQSWLDIYLYAADPATDTSVASNYNILLGTVPAPSTGTASGTAHFDLLSALDTLDFEALFKGPSLLYLVADCHYMFDKASLHLEADAVPIPTTLLLLASGLVGLIGFKRRINR
ncbi:MAG: hypothetical protein DRH37_05305 [Deltaproteobacteria bacterium]|nr:MAG: hypothetical protein DRH37_05305 [Deltaproteobacteria bacterium]